MSLLSTANSGRPRRERITLMLRFTRRDIAINQRGSKSEHSPVRDLVGRSLKQVLAEYGVRPSITAACRSAFLGRCSRVEHVEGRDGMVLHQISLSRWELSIKVTNQAAVERVLSAQRVLSQLESRDQYPLLGGSLRTSTPW